MCYAGGGEEGGYPTQPGVKNALHRNTNFFKKFEKWCVRCGRCGNFSETLYWQRFQPCHTFAISATPRSGVVIAGAIVLTLGAFFKARLCPLRNSPAPIGSPALIASDWLIPAPWRRCGVSLVGLDVHTGKAPGGASGGVVVGVVLMLPLPVKDSPLPSVSRPHRFE